MKKFATTLIFALSCVAVAGYAQENEESVLDNSEVSVSDEGNKGSSETTGEAVPQQQADESDCGCGKPKN